MIKVLLSVFVIVGLMPLSIGQIEINYNGTNYAESAYNITAGSGTVGLDLLVKNVSGSSKSISVKRERIDEQASWTDYLCWGPATNDLLGVCYTPSQMDMSVWATPDAILLEDGESGKLKVTITTNDPDMGPATYRYTILEGTAELTSMDIVFSKNASVEEVKPSLSVTVAPNPASEFIKVKTNGVENTTVKVLDVLGNVVLNTSVIEKSKTLDVAEFKNGIYFVIVEAPDAKAVNHKIIVRH